MPVIITSRGSELAAELGNHIRTTPSVIEICSLIARLARTHHRLQEEQCNRELSEQELARETQIERRIQELVAQLPPTTSGKRVTAKFTGDPRGYTVRIVVPDDPHGGNTWGRGGEYGV
jgi:hypothetical protein